MARKPKKKALYEVISRTKPRPGHGMDSEQLTLKKTEQDQETTEKSDKVLTNRTVQWPRRPRIVQFNAGRIELSMPYQLAIALLLGIVLLVLVFFRLGQMSIPAQQSQAGSSDQRADSGRADTLPAPVTDISRTSQPKEPGTTVESRGHNRIVIQTYLVRTQLEPVKKYFDSLGIETEIRKIDQWYYLVTKDKYENPKRPGTDGYAAKQRIIKLGSDYKAPPGYETFGERPFHDAYGKRFDD